MARHRLIPARASLIFPLTRRSGGNHYGLARAAGSIGPAASPASAHVTFIMFSSIHKRGRRRVVDDHGAPNSHSRPADAVFTRLLRAEKGESRQGARLP